MFFVLFFLHVEDKLEISGYYFSAHDCLCKKWRNRDSNFQMSIFHMQGCTVIQTDGEEMCKREKVSVHVGLSSLQNEACINWSAIYI